MSLSVVNDSLWKFARGDHKNENIYQTHSGFGLIEIEMDKENYPLSKTHDLKLPLIRGILTEPFTYNMESNWEPIQAPFDLGITDTFSDVSSALGGGNIGAQYTSKLYWRQSGYEKVSPKFRIYDYNGTGEAAIYAKLLITYLISPKKQQTLTGVTKYVDFLVKKLDDIHKRKLGNKDLEKLTASEKVAKYTWEATGQLAKGYKDNLTLRFSPPPMIVRMGRTYKTNNMVATSINIEYSKEYSENGPLWVDIGLDLTSKQIIANVSETGLTGSGGDNNYDISIGDV